jgi:UDPglucose 6-dehydrogenase
MSVTEAELTKLSVNCFLTTKISYANMVGDICNRYGANPSKVLSAIGTDSRIGGKYLNYGYGFGGPCFPRDNRALSKCAEEVGVDAVISKATDVMNELHLEYQVQDFFTKNPNKDIPVEIEYVTYKKDSTSIEESQQLKFALELKNMGYNVKLKDQRPEVLNQIQNLIK